MTMWGGLGAEQIRDEESTYWHTGGIAGETYESSQSAWIEKVESVQVVLGNQGNTGFNYSDPYDSVDDYGNTPAAQELYENPFSVAPEKEQTLFRFPHTGEAPVETTKEEGSGGTSWTPPNILGWQPPTVGFPSDPVLPGLTLPSLINPPGERTLPWIAPGGGIDLIPGNLFDNLGGMMPMILMMLLSRD